MKNSLLLLILFALAGCTESVLDPNDLGGGGNGGGIRTDMVYYNVEVVNIGMGSYRRVHRISLDRTDITISDHGFISSPPVGAKLVYIDDEDVYFNTIYLANLDGSNKSIMVRDSFIQSASLSPDGKSLLYTREWDSAGVGFCRIYLSSLSNPSGGILVTEKADPMIIPTISPNGQYIAYAQLDVNGPDQLNVYNVSSGSTTSIDVGLNSVSIDLEFDWTSDSKQILTLMYDNRTFSQDVGFVDPETGIMTPLSFPYGSLPIFPVISSKNEIAVVGYDLTTQTSDIYIYKNNSWQQLTNTVGTTEVLPHYSADGNKLVYSSIPGMVDPFVINTVVVSSLVVHDATTDTELTSGSIVRPLFPR